MHSFLTDGYTVSDVVMYWTSKPVQGVEAAELPQFTILGFETTDKLEKLATGNLQHRNSNSKLECRCAFN